MAEFPDSVYEKLDKLSPERRANYLRSRGPVGASLEESYSKWKSRPGVGESAFRGAADFGLSFLSGELAGVTNAVTQKAVGIDEPFVDLYREGRKDWESRNKEAASSHPGAYYGAGAPAALLTTPAAITLKGGAALGALGAAGASEADLTAGELPEFLKDTAVGAGLGGAASAVAPYASKAVGAVTNTVTAPIKKAANWVGEKLGTTAELRAFKAANPDLADYVKLDREGAAESGRAMLESGAIKAGDDVTKISERLKPLKQKAGQELENEITQSGVKISSDDLANHLEATVLDRYKGKPAYEDIAKSLEDEITKIRKFGTATLNDAEKSLKRPYQDVANLEKKAGTPTASAKHELAGTLREGIEDQVFRQDPAGYKRFVLAKKKYENLAPAEKAANKGALKAERNRYFSLSDYLAAGSGLAAGYKSQDPIKGAAIFLGVKGLHRFARTRGASTAAVVADTLSKALKSKSPQIQAVAATLAQNPSKLGRFVEDLMNAAARSEEEFLQMHAVLAKDKEYRRKTRKAEKYYQKQ